MNSLYMLIGDGVLVAITTIRLGSMKLIMDTLKVVCLVHLVNPFHIKMKTQISKKVIIIVCTLNMV
jgi:hypothetical protein